MIAQDKRNKLAEDMPDSSLVILSGKSEVIRNGDVHYPFRQDSDFLLLTGLDIPDLMLVGMKKGGAMTWTLYSDPLTDHEKLWGASRLAHADLRSLSGIVDIREKSSWKSDIEKYISKVDRIVVRDTDAKALSREIGKHHKKYSPLEPYMKELRMIKTPEEIEKIRRAISITKEAYDTIRANIEPGLYEYEIEALVAGVYRSHHMTEAYPTIVASGKNACTLHYTRHTSRVQEGDLVLVDFGAEHEGYAADITRVFVAGDFSPRQKEVYASVLAVKEYAESLIRPGVLKLEYEKLVRERMNEELVKLGLIPEGTSGEEWSMLSRKYYPHSTSHFLGLDVHDTGGRDEVFRAGMVITCEPGIYIPEERIGIRLEDDILITDYGCENLSKNIQFFCF